MQESAERVVEVGFKRRSKDVIDEVERMSAVMIRAGWTLSDTVMEENLGNIHLFFVRDIDG
jgi:hypothetical protein